MHGRSNRRILLRLPRYRLRRSLHHQRNFPNWCYGIWFSLPDRLGVCDWHCFCDYYLCAYFWWAFQSVGLTFEGGKKIYLYWGAHKLISSATGLLPSASPYGKASRGARNLSNLLGLISLTNRSPGTSLYYEPGFRRLYCGTSSHGNILA